MKNLFPGHFKKNEDEIKRAWNTSLFVFDANILLNLYRYSSSTSKEFIQILTKIKKRSWLPHRAAEEYLNGRLGVIRAQEIEYEKKIKEMEIFSQAFENTRQHPFISKQLMKDVKNVFSRLRSELEQNKKLHEERISGDDIKESLAEIFYESVGAPYNRETMDKILKDGEYRFSQKIPPGYKDSNKNINPDVFIEKCRIYGDYILWKQVIDKSKSEKIGIILVTDDKKEDWWEQVKGKTIGPRPELIKEFRDETNQEIYMYRSDNFLVHARTEIGTNISNDTVDEIREVRQQNTINYKTGITDWAHNEMPEHQTYEEAMISKYYSVIHANQHEISRLQDEADIFEREVRLIEEKIKKALDNKDAKKSTYDPLMKKYEHLIEQQEEIVESMAEKMTKTRSLLEKIEYLELLKKQKYNHEK